MKANDIQIGDWLYSIIDRYDHVEKKLCKVTGIRTDSDTPLIQCNDTDVWYPLDSYEPVPLTAEILEKNGFEKVYDKYKLPNYRIKWNSYTDLYFTVFTGVDGYWNPIGLNVITGGIPATVDYVHQLQNALRLCGIKKEIIL